MTVEPKYTWSEDLGIATAELYVDNKHCVGKAYVAEEDEEFANEFVGCQIAEMRMSIDYARQHIEYDLKPQLFILNHLLGTMRLSPRFDNNSYEAKRIYAERQNILDDIEQFKSYIKTTKECLKEYIAEKDKFYREIERYRQQAKKAENN
jgi:hypothetical protein